jgi:TetR/AcrR family transcriptional regulator, cholesterol catabolism regulator
VSVGARTASRKRASTTQRKPPSPRQRQIYLEAAKLFQERGYGGMSMSDLAEAVNLTKAGLYHSITNKEDLLFTIVQYGMDDFEEQVFDPCRDIEDPLERLRTALTLHVRNVMRVRNGNGNPITSAVEQTFGLSPERARLIARRKKEYMYFVRDALEDLRKEGRLLKTVDTTIASLTLIGMVMGAHKWYKGGGRLSADVVTRQVVSMGLRSVVRPEALD